MSKDYKNPQNAVDRIRSGEGKDVPLDYFLYSCFETEKTASKLNKEEGSSGYSVQWPMLQDTDEDTFKDETADQELLDLWEDLMSWYAANYPDFTAAAWDYEAIATIIPALLAMARDLADVHAIKMGEPIPEFDPNWDIRPSSWQLLDRLVRQFFNRKSNYILRYFEWSFAKEKSKPAESSGSRPPVGRFAPGRSGAPRSSHGNRGGGGGNYDRGRRGGGDRGRGRGDRDRGHRGGGRDGYRERDSHEGHQRQFHDRQNNEELERQALNEAEEAVKHLQSNPDEKTVMLRPQNSFYRRLQHQAVTSVEGFGSESTGEGRDRAVVVMRK